MEYLESTIYETESDVDSVERDLDILQDKTKQIQKYKAILAYKGEVSRLDDLSQRIENLEAEIDDIGDDLDQLRSLTARHEKSGEDLQVLKDLFHKEFPDHCPLCGKEVEH
jgi:DNA repair exonuclease SbcCD ATPase subunit